MVVASDIAFLRYREEWIEGMRVYNESIKSQSEKLVSLNMVIKLGHSTLNKAVGSPSMAFELLKPKQKPAGKQFYMDKLNRGSDFFLSECQEWHDTKGRSKVPSVDGTVGKLLPTPSICHVDDIGLTAILSSSMTSNQHHHTQAGHEHLKDTAISELYKRMRDELKHLHERNYYEIGGASDEMVKQINALQDAFKKWKLEMLAEIAKKELELKAEVSRRHDAHKAKVERVSRETIRERERRWYECIAFVRSLERHVVPSS